MQTEGPHANVSPIACLAFLAATCLWTAAPCQAADAAGADKSRFTLFDPTPRELMREMSTDRPDATESPYTVDAGHVQVELSLLEYTYDGDGGRTDAFAVLPTNLKVGLSNNVDLQLVLSPYENVRTKVGGVNHRVDGFGETLVRLKVNLGGNDGGDVAFGVMPFVKLPTGRGELGNDHVEGGLILPVTFKLPYDFELGAMAEFDVVRDAVNEGYGIEYVHTVTLNHPIVGELAGFVEYAGFAPSDLRASYRASLDVGLTYAVNEDVQLDAGVFLALLRAADDATFFLGLTVRR